MGHSAAESTVLRCRAAIVDMIAEGVTVSQDAIARRLELGQGTISAACKRLKERGEYPAIPERLTPDYRREQRAIVSRSGKSSATAVEKCREAIITLVDRGDVVSTANIADLSGYKRSTVIDAVRQLHESGSHPDVPPDLRTQRTYRPRPVEAMPAIFPKPKRAVQRDHGFSRDVDRVLLAERRIGIGAAKGA